MPEGLSCLQLRSERRHCARHGAGSRPPAVLLLQSVSCQRSAHSRGFMLCSCSGLAPGSICYKHLRA